MVCQFPGKFGFSQTFFVENFQNHISTKSTESDDDSDVDSDVKIVNSEIGVGRPFLGSFN